MKKALVCPLFLAACAHAPLPPEAPLVPYQCEGDYTTITADYYAKDPKTSHVVLTMNDKKLTLKLQDSSPAGDRYTSDSSLKSGTTIWWNKESRAILATVATSPNGYAFEKQVAACGNNPNPLVPTSLPALTTGTAMEGSIPGTAPGFMYKTIANPGVK